LTLKSDRVRAQTAIPSTNLTLPRQNRSPASLLVVLLAGLAAIYVIPFYLPVRDGLSVSYMLGFSNRAAMLILVTFVLGFGIWTRGLGFSLPDSMSASAPSLRRTGYLAIAWTIAGALFVWLCARAMAPLGEAQYFLDRLEMFRMGGHLYRDFAFDYGPLMFYPPVWIAHLCHISPGNAHYAAWTLQWALGVWTLWKIVDIAARGTRHGRTIFLFLWAFLLIALINGGPNYTPLRFCGALAFALGVHHLHARGAPSLLTFGLASIGATTMFFYSPEQGIVLTAGTAIFFLLCARPARPGTLAGLASFALVMTAVFWLGLKLGMLDNVRSVGGGTLNLPLLFSYQTLVLLLQFLVAGCVLVAAFRRHTTNHPLLYLLCLSAVSAPAAFSRADVGHIILNTLGALIVALVVLSQYSAIWRWTWPAFAIMLVLAAYAHLNSYRGAFREQVEDAAFGTQMHSPAVEKIYTAFLELTSRNPQQHIAVLRREHAEHTDPGAPSLPFQTHLFAPLGVQRRLSPFPGDPQIVTGYYHWFFPMTSTSATQENISELESHPDWPLLLQARSPLWCRADSDEFRMDMKRLLLAPYMPKLVHEVSGVQPFCDYLFSHYVLTPYVSPVPGYYVWVLKTDPSTTTNGITP
jgi:hypothetical protein